MFSKNLLNFTTPMITEGNLAIDWTDEVIAGTALTHGGAVVHPMVAQVLGLDNGSLPTADAASAPTDEEPQS
jgi:NAD(P) transhydrogenase subunit alpha